VVEERFAGGEVGIGCDRPIERKWQITAVVHCPLDCLIQDRRVLAEQGLKQPLFAAEKVVQRRFRDPVAAAISCTHKASYSSLPIAPVPLENGLGNALSTWLKTVLCLS